MPQGELELEKKKKPVVTEIQEEQQEELKETSQEISLSSFMNVGDTMIEHMDAPLMKHAARLPELKDLKKPNEAMVLAAHKDVGLALSKYNWRHPKRVSRAKAKYERQMKLLDLKKKTYEPDDEFLEIEVNRVMNLDLTKLLYEKDEKEPDEILISRWGKLQQNFAYIDACAKSIEKDRKKENLTDAQKDDLLRQEAHLKTLVDIRTYYQVQEALVSNRYYALLPREDMRKLSESDLRAKLAKLYEKDGNERNDELIDYYQNLLRFKTLKISDGSSVKKKEAGYLRDLRGTEYADKRDAKDEMEKISDAYKKLLGVRADKGFFYSYTDSNKRQEQFFDILGKDIEKFKDKSGFTEKRTLIRDYNDYLKKKEELKNKKRFEQVADTVGKTMEADGEKLEKRDKPMEGLTLSERQKAGIHRIQGFLLRRAWQERNSKDAYIYNFLQTPPEQQLIAFYLVEKGKESSFVPADLYTAINSYEPNLDAFRDKVNISKFKLGGTKWDKMSKAVQAVKSLKGELKNYVDLTVKTEAAEAELKSAESDPQEYTEQGKKTIEAIALHTAAIKQMYDNCGMHEDMPPDMAQEEKLRERMFTEYNRIGELLEKLVRILEEHPELAQKAELNDYMVEAGESKYTESKKKGLFATAFGVGKSFKSTYGTVTTVEGYAAKAVGLFTGAVKQFQKNNMYYNAIKGSFSELSSVVGYIDNIIGAFNMSKEETVSLTDSIVKWTNKSTSLIGGAKGLISGAVSVLKTTKVVSKESKKLAKMGKSFDGIGLFTGGLSLGMNFVKLGQVVDSGHDIKLGKKKLEQRIKGRKASKDEKKLMKFFRHQSRENQRQKISAAVDIVKSTISFSNGLFGMTGVLAPVAGVLKIVNTVIGIAHGTLYNGWRRKKNIELTVDEYLGVDNIIKELEKNPDNVLIDSKGKKKLRKVVRYEALAQLGYATHKECYNDICSQFAQLVYSKLFLGASKDAEEWNLFNRALTSLGFDPVMYKKDFGTNPKPSMKLILAKVLG